MWAEERNCICVLLWSSGDSTRTATSNLYHICQQRCATERQWSMLRFHWQLHNGESLEQKLITLAKCFHFVSSRAVDDSTKLCISFQKSPWQDKPRQWRRTPICHNLGLTASGNRSARTHILLCFRRIPNSRNCGAIRHFSWIAYGANYFYWLDLHRCHVCR